MNFSSPCLKCNSSAVELLLNAMHDMQAEQANREANRDEKITAMMQVVTNLTQLVNSTISPNVQATKVCNSPIEIDLVDYIFALLS